MAKIKKNLRLEEDIINKIETIGAGTKSFTTIVEEALSYYIDIYYGKEKGDILSTHLISALQSIVETESKELSRKIDIALFREQTIMEILKENLEISDEHLKIIQDKIRLSKVGLER